MNCDPEGGRRGNNDKMYDKNTICLNYKPGISAGWGAFIRKTGSQEFVFDPERVLGL